MNALIEKYMGEPNEVQLAFRLVEEPWISEREYDVLMLHDLTGGDDPQVLDQSQRQLAFARRWAWSRWCHHRFRWVTCPECGVQGLASWRFLGRLRHPACGATWTASPLAWIGMQGRTWFNQSDGSDNGCLDAIKKFIAGLAMGLLLWFLTIILFLPLQCLVFAISERKRRSVGAMASLIVPLVYLAASIWIAASVSH